jgi:elongator complex protein 3
MIREVHVYGRVARLGVAGPSDLPAGPPQHRGLGRRLVRRAAELAAAAGYERLVVISAVGTRRYYRRLGFADGDLYQHLALPAAS